MRVAGRVLMALVALAVASARPALAATPSERYRPPTEAPVVDRFRPPPSPYGAGNRGWAYATAEGAPIRAAGAGVVVFAGTVGAGRYVTVRHPDGLRTSYSFLASVAVRSGAAVAAGDVVGTATDHFHFGVRDPEGRYLDPASLFGAPTTIDGARLLPDGEADTTPRRAPRDGRTDAASWRDALPPSDADADPAQQRASDAARLWYRPRGACTPVSAPPPVVNGRHVVVLVGGLGSTSERAGIDTLDLSAAGVDPRDVIRFSYAGGRVPDPTDGADLQRVAASAHGALATQQAIAASSALLVTLLRDVRAALPGVVIDVVAHSQGGLVARHALASLPEGEIATVITIATPHGGAPLADVLHKATPRSVPGSTGAAAGLLASVGSGLDPHQPVFDDLRSDGPLVRGLASAPPPTGARLVSIAGSGDLVVPATRTLARGFDAVLVPIHGASAHDRLPGDPAVAREVALALADRRPGCTGMAEVLGGAAEALVIDAVETRAAR